MLMATVLVKGAASYTAAMGGQLGPAVRGLLLAAGWLGGVALQFQQAQLLPSLQAAALCAAALVLALAGWHWRRGALVALLLAGCAAALAFGSTTLRAWPMLQDRLAPALEGADLLVTGVIAELPRTGPSGTRFVLETESATLRGTPVRLPERLALGWYRAPDDEGPLSGPAEELRAGQRWRFTVRLRQPHGTLNPQGFDLELWSFERGLGASGSVRARPGMAPQKLAEAAGHPVERLRQRLRDAITLRVADAQAAGVLAALAIGDQASIDREGWDLFRITGVAHLMSISGLHVTMFAWLAGALVGRLWRLHPRLPLRLPAPQAARLGGLLAAASYALLAGWGVPAQRTVWMIATVVLLRSAGLRWPLHAVLLAAALAVTLADPWALLQPGFWLSFVAVGLLAASEPVFTAVDQPQGWRAQALHLLRGGLRTQLVATLGLAPLSMLFFQQISIVGFLANLVAIPLVTLLVTPLALLGVVLPPLWSLAGALVQGLNGFLQVLAGWPLALWTAAAAPPWAVACGLLAGALAVLPLPWRLRLLALPLVLPLLAPPVPRPAPGQFELVAADIGQGTAVLVRTRAHLLLFDTGPAYSPEADAGGRVLLPLLRARGEKAIDLLMLSHRDTDHVGGAATLLAALPVRQLASSLAEDHPLRGRGLPHQRCLAGQQWEWDGVRFQVLHPTEADYAQATKPNALSCVLRVQGAQASALLTGDIEAAQEAALLQRAADSLRAEVLLVPHHGSRTSSTTGFLAAVQPRVALVQAAYRSRFGHPAPEVLARYEGQGVEVQRSDRCGAYTLPAGGGAGVCERRATRRYWHHQLPAAAPGSP
jgi:competence protein ComEC